MASTKISELTAASTLVGTETMPVVQSGVTKAATVSQIRGSDGNNSTALGSNSLSGRSTGSSNVAVGYNAGYRSGSPWTVTVSQCTLLGADIILGSSGVTNATAVGYGAVASTSHAVQLGNGSVTSVTGGPASGCSLGRVSHRFAQIWLQTGINVAALASYADDAAADADGGLSVGSMYRVGRAVHIKP